MPGGGRAPLREALRDRGARSARRCSKAEIAGLGRRLRIDLSTPTSAGAPSGGAPARRSASRRAADPFGLTTREREVLALVAEGYTNRRIAETLFISESTAGVHVSNILGKLGVETRTEAATIAVRLGLDLPQRRASRAAGSAAPP